MYLIRSNLIISLRRFLENQSEFNLAGPRLSFLMKCVDAKNHIASIFKPSDIQDVRIEM